MSNSNNLDLENYLDGLLAEDLTGRQSVPVAQSDLKTNAIGSDPRLKDSKPKPEAVPPESLRPVKKAHSASKQNVLDTPEAKHFISLSSDAPKLTHAEPQLDVATKQRLQQLLSPNIAKAEADTSIRAQPELKPSESSGVIVDKPSSDNNGRAIDAKKVDKAQNSPAKLPTDKSLGKTHSGASRPEWASQSFDVLMVDVNGLTIAVPLITLGQIHPLNDELTPIVGRAKWFLGMLPTGNGQIYVLNSAMYVMPERYKEDCVNNYKYVVTLADSSWGLAVDSVQQPTRLSPEEVTWRTNLSKRPWLAGTIKSAMCALVDAPTLDQILRDNLPPA